MARSLRSKRKQANKRKLRADVFAPVEAARTARLAAAQKKIADEPKHAEASKTADEPTKDSEPKNAGETKSVEEATPMEEDTIQNDNSGMLPGTSARPPPPQDGKAGFLHISVPETLGSDLPKTAYQMLKEQEFFMRLGIGIDGLEVVGVDLLGVKFTEDIVGLMADNTNKD